MAADKIRVLMTGAGGAGTIEVLQSLAKTERYFTIGADASVHAGGYAFADRSYVIPFGAADEFEAALERIVDAERPEFVIPTVDEEIPKVHALARRRGGFRVVAPRPEFCAATLDKWETFRALDGAGLGTAATWLANDARGCTYPAVVKPRDGRGSRDVAYLETPADLERYLSRAERPADRFVVQERLEGVEYTTSVVVTLDGRLLAVVPKEVVVKRGITQVGVTRRSAAIDALGRAIQEKLRADGPFNVQLIVGKDGVPKVIEINPRYSTTVALTLGAGLDEVDAVLRSALGEDRGPLAWRPDLMMVRYNAQLFVPENEWAPRTA